MYSRLPYFVFGFHGCDITTKEAVISGKTELIPSKNDYDWLGSGIYFWEQNYQRALEFAKMSQLNPKKRFTNFPINEPAVIGAVIDFGYCLNLLDSAHISKLQMAYNLLKNATMLSGKEMPANSGHYPDKPLRRLDRAVIEMLHTHEEDEKSKPYDTVRGIFQEGGDTYPGAGFREQTHIQICVRNINCIKGYFDPRETRNHGFVSERNALPST